MQLVAPSAVSIADAIEAISCTINLAVSFFVIVFGFPTDYTDYTDFFILPYGDYVFTD